MNASFHFPFTNSPRYKSLMLHNLTTDYSAQALLRGRHLVLIYHLAFIKQWPTLNAKSMVNDQCEMINVAGGGV